MRPEASAGTELTEQSKRFVLVASRCRNVVALEPGQTRSSSNSLGSKTMARAKATRSLFPSGQRGRVPVSGPLKVD